MKKEYYRLKLKREAIEDKMKSLIIRAIRVNGGRITFRRTEDEEEYPLTTILPDEKDIYFISITDVYLNNEERIYAEGVDDDTLHKRSELKIEEDQYDNILYFIGHVLRWADKTSQQDVMDSINTSIIHLANELAEKEMSDKHGLLPKHFMTENGECYTERFQNEFNPLYDKYFDRIAKLVDFEYKSVQISD